MSTDGGYERGNYLRVCDVCGVRYHFRDLTPIGELRFACPDDAPGLTSMQISRYNARAKPLVVRPNKWAKDYAETPIYQLAEAQIFNFIAKVAPADDYDGAANSLAAAWAAIYMADIVNQAKRPAVWIAKAKAVIATCCTRLLARQCGAGLLPDTLVIDSRYGGIADGGLVTGGEFSTATWDTETTIAAGVAFLKAYQALGTVAYLTAADRCATFIRHVQSGAKAFASYTVFPAGGGRYDLKGLASGVADVDGRLTDIYNIRDIAGAWFLTLLADVRGLGALYGNTVGDAFFSIPCQASIETMLAELRAFAETGVQDSTTGTTITGLSTTTPRATYQAATSGRAGVGSWFNNATIGSTDIATGTLGMYQANGLTTQVSGIMTWLAAFGANFVNAIPVGQLDAVTLAGIQGTYAPAICPANDLTTGLGGQSLTEAAGTVYNWASLGLLAPILSAQNAGTFRTSKDALSTARRFSTLDIGLKYLGVLGLSGLDFQPASIGRSVTRAAKAGLAYRYTPGRYPQLRGN